MKIKLIPVAAMLLAGFFTLTVERSLPAQILNNSSIDKPLPQRFFNENTILLARIEVSHANIERIYQSVSAIIPADTTARFQQAMQSSMTGGEAPSDALAAMGTLRQLADNPDQLETLKKQNPNHPLNLVDRASAKLLAADVSELYLVLMNSGVEGNTNPNPFFLINRDGREGSASAASRHSAFTEVAGSIGATVSEDQGWLVAGMTTLPPAGDDFGLDEVAFLEALQTNPMHDLMVAFVPDETMRVGARDEFAQSIEKTPEHERGLVPVLEGLVQVLDGDWYYASVRFGDDPALRVSAHFADASKPAVLADSLNNLINRLPEVALVKPSGNPTVQEIRENNSKVQLQLFQSFRFDSSGPFLTCDLDRANISGMLAKALEMRTEPADNSPSAIDPTSGGR